MKRIFSAVIIGLFAAATLAEAPFISPADDHLYLGNPDNILFWGSKQKVAGFRNSQLISPVARVAAGPHVLELAKNTLPLGATRLVHRGRSLTIDDYFTEFNTAGLLVIKDAVIVYERYDLGNNRDTRWNSFSVAKSVTSMLLGAAIKDGYIDNVDEYVTDYLPALQGSAYDGVTIRHILHMTSGVAWDENYADPESDISTVQWSSQKLYQHLQVSQRSSAPGEVFNYSTAETQLVGDVVRSATGMSLSKYLGDRIWRPFGMESDAYWQLTAPGEGEFGGSSLNATLRDYGRLGLFALGGGTLANGEEVLTEGWMTDSVTASATNAGYGYQWWLGTGGVFEASGIFGQSIYVDPKNAIVIAQHGARDSASEQQDWDAQAAAFRAISEAIGK